MLNAECANCPLLARVDKMEEKYSESRKQIYDRLTKLEKSSAVTDDRYDRILKEIEEINAKLENLSSQPQKRWDTAVAGSISAVVGGLIGVVITKIFGGR